MATGYQSPAGGDGVTPADAVTAWELETNVSDCKVSGGFGSDVEAEISNNVVKFKITATAASDITTAQGDVSGVVYENTPGEAAPA